MEGPGSRIGRYRIQEKIGEGGFGVVYRAEQEPPLRREVALKIIKPGMDTLEIIAHFETERHALAQLNHPNVAQIFDAGATETGRPYFVMELVKGIPITTYCDQRRLNPRQRIEMFLVVCDAVKHAHQKGIIHRDLKPANILVNDKGQPKVIDFSVAKAISHEGLGETLFTQAGFIVGTPEYMSPEQAHGGDALDVVSDVYSLGVILYELLTGVPPFDPNRLSHAGYVEMLRILTEEDPPAPSAKLSSLGGRLEEVASRRAILPVRLGQLLRRDLDWVVMKALSKEKHLRYPFVHGLALDLRRFLLHQPVSASPPSPAYRIRKFVRRHRMAVVAGCCALLALVTGTAMSVGFAIRAAREAAHAQDLKRLAEYAEERALESERTALAWYAEAMTWNPGPGPETIAGELEEKFSTPSSGQSGVQQKPGTSFDSGNSSDLAPNAEGLTEVDSEVQDPQAAQVPDSGAHQPFRFPGRLQRNSGAKEVGRWSSPKKHLRSARDGSRERFSKSQPWRPGGSPLGGR